ncbi:glycosyltransferase family 26 domain-containing protein [Methylophaga lonarensis MPL]|uniref:Glycosyltransferase family 26 domain-containing protein n=1 Tax=Methylophaga lonarensis MPL TaxID=1286106 RepID=M7P4D9_9GAMM|nr:WecB/TagA/CpsF family glycosyltransferase [Methylophaga lonarensis]EMR14366.1 glycosyltransferase family 26 domain-containing protein [Methylophaga lonarensis MPL]
MSDISETSTPANTHDAMGFDKTCLLGLPFDCVSMAEAIAAIEHAIDSRSRCFLSTPNLNFAMTAQADPSFYQSVLESDLSVADGMPLVWTSRLMGAGVSVRVAGSDLFARLTETPRAKKIRVFFFGGASGIAEKAHHALNTYSPGAMSCGFYDPGFVDLDAMSKPEVIALINKAEPDFIVVALGAKKGQAWIMQNRDSLNAPVISHLGAVINFVAGEIERAPTAWQKSGLEWLWRIVQEPALWKRYVGDGAKAVWMLLSRILPFLIYRQIFRWSGTAKKALKIELTEHNDRLILSGALDSQGVELLERELAKHFAEREHVTLTLDLKALQYADLRGLAYLVSLSGRVKRSGCSVALVNTSLQLMRLARLAGIPAHFKLTSRNTAERNIQGDKVVD